MSIDEKDIEIAKLRGHVEALEKLVRQMMVAPAPQIVPMPYPVAPTVNPPWNPYPYWYQLNPADYTTTCTVGDIGGSLHYIATIGAGGNGGYIS